MSNFKTAMRITSVNMAIEFVGQSDKDEIQFKSGQDIIDVADSIYAYITQDMKEDSKPDATILNLFEGDMH